MKRESLFILALLIIPILSFAVNAQGNETSGINQALEKQIVVPENLQLVTRILLGISESSQLTFEQFIVLLVSFGIFWFLISDVLSIIPFFDEPWRAWTAGFIVTALLGVSGGLKMFVILLVDLATLFGFLASIQGIITLVIAIAILAGILYLLSNLIKSVKEQARLEVAEKEGRDIGIEMAVMKKLGKFRKSK